MASMSTDLINKLTEFLICEIGSKALDGISYMMLFKNKRDKTLYDRYKTIKDEALRCGYTDEEIFRIYEVSNGYILDMDVWVVRKITYELSKAVSKVSGEKDIIGDNPSKRRDRDIKRLAKHIQKEFDAGKDIIEVALFSRNTVPRIIITGKDQNNEVIAVKYNSYAIRHWDIENVNSEELIPVGIRVSKVEPCEILPSKTGCSFKLYIEHV